MTIALSETISLQQEAARKLENFFKPFTNSRTTILAQETAEPKWANSGNVLLAASTGIIDPDDDLPHTDDPNAGQLQENTGLDIFSQPRRPVRNGGHEDGVNELRSHTAEVSDLLSPPEMSLIHPVEDAALAGPNLGTHGPWSDYRFPFCG